MNQVQAAEDVNRPSEMIGASMRGISPYSLVVTVRLLWLDDARCMLVQLVRRLDTP